METLQEERERLRKRLEFVNVNCPVRERILQRIEVVEKELLRSQRHPIDVLRDDKSKVEQIHIQEKQTLKTDNTRSKTDAYQFRWKQ